VGQHVDAEAYIVSCKTPDIQRKKDQYLMRRVISGDFKRDNLLVQQLPRATKSYQVGGPCQSYHSDTLRKMTRSMLLRTKEIKALQDPALLNNASLVDEIIFARRNYLSVYPYNRLEDRDVIAASPHLVTHTGLDQGVYIDPTDANGDIDKADLDQLYLCFVNEPPVGQCANVYIEATARGNCVFISGGGSTIVAGSELLVRYD
jgi:hypothetical protein